MRKALVYLILIVSAIVLVCTYLVSTCIGLLFENGLQWAIQPNDLPLRDAWREDQRPIPKIIHQTWKNETIPEQWTIAHYTCLDLHPDYQYIVSSPIPVDLFVSACCGIVISRGFATLYPCRPLELCEDYRTWANMS